MAAVSHRNIIQFYGFASDIGEFPAMVSEVYPTSHSKATLLKISNSGVSMVPWLTI